MGQDHFAVTETSYTGGFSFEQCSAQASINSRRFPNRSLRK